MKDINIYLDEREIKLLTVCLVDSLLKLKKDFTDNVESNNKEQIMKQFNDYSVLHSILSKVISERKKYEK